MEEKKENEDREEEGLVREKNGEGKKRYRREEETRRKIGKKRN